MIYLSNIDLNKNQLQNAVIQPLGTPPSSPVAGQIYFDNTAGDKKMYFYNGTAWISMDASAPDNNNFVTSLAFNTSSGILTAARQGLSSLTVDLDGRYVTSVAQSHGGNAFNVSGSPITGAGTLAITMAGSAAQYISGQGNLVTFPAIPQGDITAVTVTAPITGGGTSGSIAIGHATQSNTATTQNTSLSHGGTFTAFTGLTVNATGHVTGNKITTYTLPTDGLGVETVTTGNASTITIGGSAADPTVAANTAAVTNGGANLATGDQIYDFVAGQIANIPSGLSFEGNWNASTDSPDLSGATPDNGQFWIVSVAGSTNLDGITDWKVGDWAIYVSTGAGTDGWQKVDNTSTLSGLGVAGRVSFWNGTANLTSDSGFTYNASTNALSVNGAITAGGVITASGGNSAQWNQSFSRSLTALNVTGGATKTLTATKQDGTTLTTSWTDDKGVTSVATTGPITGGTITGSGTIGISDAAAGTKGAGYVTGGTGIDVAYSGGNATVSLTATGTKSGVLAVNTSATYTYPSSMTAATVEGAIIQLVATTSNETVYADVKRLSTTTFSVTYGAGAIPAGGVTAVIFVVG